MKQEQVEQALRNAVAVQYKDKLWKYRLYKGDIQMKELGYQQLHSDETKICFNRLKINDEGYLHLDGWEIKPLIVWVKPREIAESDSGQAVFGFNKELPELHKIGIQNYNELGDHLLKVSLNKNKNNPE